MREEKARAVYPELKDLVAEAVLSLAKLDADRLEELALSCQMLNSGLAPAWRHRLASESHGAKRDMASLAQVLEATGANAAVMKLLRERSASQMEYAVAGKSQAKEREISHGLY
jgi:hypothetical protein